MDATGLTYDLMHPLTCALALLYMGMGALLLTLYVVKFTMYSLYFVDKTHFFFFFT